ncbi:hypothetical protein BJ165DRAFT_1427299 [Panaeolus papilionaceus]|nr:hypothetical protein BJ165DRAFT_1427299 [Panaeolus papilionaceus]
MIWRMPLTVITFSIVVTVSNTFPISQSMNPLDWLNAISSSSHFDREISLKAKLPESSLVIIIDKRFKAGVVILSRRASQVLPAILWAPTARSIKKGSRTGTSLATSWPSFIDSVSVS